MQFGFPHAGVKAIDEACASLLNCSSRQMAVTAPASPRVAERISKAQCEYHSFKAEGKGGQRAGSARRWLKRLLAKARREQAKLAIREALA